MKVEIDYEMIMIFEILCGNRKKEWNGNTTFRSEIRHRKKVQTDKEKREKIVTEIFTQKD